MVGPLLVPRLQGTAALQVNVGFQGGMASAKAVCRKWWPKPVPLYLIKSPRCNPTSTGGFELCCSALQLGQFVLENLHRLIELLNLQWLLQNRDRTDL